MSLLREIKDVFGSAYLFCPSQDLTNDNHPYVSIFPKLGRFDNLTPEILQKICERQKSLIDDRPPNIKDSDINCLIILDDVCGDKKIASSSFIKNIINMSRHFAITFIYLAQYYIDIHKNIRGQARLLILKGAHADEKGSAMEREIMSGVENYKKYDFFNMVNHYTKDYNSFVRIKNNNSYKLENCVFQYHPVRPLDENGNLIKFKIENCRMQDTLLKYFICTPETIKEYKLKNLKKEYLKSKQKEKEEKEEDEKEEDEIDLENEEEEEDDDINENHEGH